MALDPETQARAILRSPFVYGTAWKKDETATLVYNALLVGVRAIDTAAQPRHYREKEVGDGIRAALNDGIVRRDQVTIQTKFTWISGQDLGTQPFDADAPIHVQVRQSIDNSLLNLRPRSEQESVSESYIDCVLLHFPLPTLEQTLQAWTTLQTYCPTKIRRLGISNTSLPIVQVLLLAKSVTVNPTLVQNRLCAETGFDRELRGFCKTNEIEYQCFGVLKSNPKLLADRCVMGLSSDARVSPESALYFLVLDLGNVSSVLNGTRQAERLRKDLEELEMLQSWKAVPAHEETMEQVYRPRLRSVIDDDQVKA